MLERQREGIAKAKAAGSNKGGPVSIDAAQIRQLRAELGPAAIAKRLGIARSSVYRVLGRSRRSAAAMTHFPTGQAASCWSTTAARRSRTAQCDDAYGFAIQRQTALLVLALTLTACSRTALPS